MHGSVERGNKMSKLTVLPLLGNEIYNEKLLSGSVNYIKSKGLEVLENCEITGSLEYTGDSITLEKVYTKFEKLEKASFVRNFRELDKLIKNIGFKEYRKSLDFADYIIKNYN